MGSDSHHNDIIHFAQHFSPEPDEELVLSLLEKSLLVLVWTMSMVYSILTPQLVSDQECDVREDPFSTLGTVSAFMALVLPLIFGPVGALLAICLTTIFSFLGGEEKVMTAILLTYFTWCFLL